MHTGRTWVGHGLDGAGTWAGQIGQAGQGQDRGRTCAPMHVPECTSREGIPTRQWWDNHRKGWDRGGTDLSG
eukprot:365719-Amorphochlora_amoeboformis.AAC.1